MLLFDTPELYLSPVHHQNQHKVERSVTFVNTLANFSNHFFRGLDMPKLAKISFWRSSLVGSGLTLPQLVTEKVIKFLN